MKLPKNIPWVARDTRIKFCTVFLKCVPGGATKTQIVYNSGLNFHLVVPHPKLIIRNGLAVRVEGDIPGQKTTSKGSRGSGISRSGKSEKV